MINSITKHGQPLSGSLGFFGSGNRGKAYGATIGGTLVKDRMWFFASGEEQTVARPSGVTVSALPTARQSLLASFAATGPEASVQRTFAPTTPSSFLNLHYTGILSSNMFVTASVSQQRANPPN